jgi:TetR/AcrR family transcriptional regulator, tetracycline repressor protein
VVSCHLDIRSNFATCRQIGPESSYPEKALIAMPRPPTISRETVARAALEIVDQEGLEALSIERIASALGVKGPSLYHHFTDKADIHAEVARLVLRDVSLDHPDDDWEAWLLEVNVSFYRAVTRHPNFIPVLMQHMPDSVALPGFGKAATVLAKAGIDPSLQVMLMSGTEKLTWGWVLRATMDSQRNSLQEWRKASRKWPALADAVRACPWATDELFEQSLRAYVQGVLGMTVTPELSPDTPSRNGKSVLGRF